MHDDDKVVSNGMVKSSDDFDVQSQKICTCSKFIKGKHRHMEKAVWLFPLKQITSSTL